MDAVDILSGKFNLMLTAIVLMALTVYILGDNDDDDGYGGL